MGTEVSYLREILGEQKIPTLAQLYSELSLQFASKSVYFIVNSIDQMFYGPQLRADQGKKMVSLLITQCYCLILFHTQIHIQSTCVIHT